MTNTLEQLGKCPGWGVSVLLPIMPSFFYIFIKSMTDVRESGSQEPGKRKGQDIDWNRNKQEGFFFGIIGRVRHEARDRKSVV